MAGRRHDEGRACPCDLPDGTCAGLLVRRLSQDRVWELAEEIWTASSRDVLPARPLLGPRSSRAGASLRPPTASTASVSAQAGGSAGSGGPLPSLVSLRPGV
jgi:hypothetical protein